MFRIGDKIVVKTVPAGCDNCLRRQGKVIEISSDERRNKSIRVEWLERHDICPAPCAYSKSQLRLITPNRNNPTTAT